MSSLPRQIAILGSTGSIGRNTLEVLRNLPERFSVCVLTTNRNTDLLAEQVREFRPRVVVVLDHEKATAFKRIAPQGTEVLSGKEGLLEVVRREDVTLVVNALVGFAGLRPTVEAVRHGKDVALANKETLVVAGESITALVRERRVRLIPIDSEHSAILQCLLGEDQNPPAKLILTASGGPFLHTPAERFRTITVEEALNHPNWRMGRKITIDSATLMNKGLEVIEAHWLFDLPAERIEVVIHPQSIIHSMVEFADGSVKAQLGLPDMKIPIQYALTAPERIPLNGGRVDFPALQSMTFFAPDRKKFRCLQLAYDALAAGGTAPAVMNAANEVAVEAFLAREIPFDEIPKLISRALDAHQPVFHPSLEEIMGADHETRAFVRTLLSAGVFKNSGNPPASTGHH
jgi:1-deoxy-D-xylulose-5-phosphate reductoisomerase